MFRLKKTKKPGQCEAMRCTKDAEHGVLCPRHHDEWVKAGSPSFDHPDPSKAPTLAALAKVQKEAEAERDKAQECLAMVDELPLETEEERELVAEFINVASKTWSELNKRKLAATESRRKEVNEINAWFEEPLRLYKKVKAQLQARYNARMAELEAAQLQAQAELDKDPVGSNPEAVQAAHATPQQAGGLKKKVHYDIVVTNINAVPEEYITKVVNEELVLLEASKYGERTNIPGLIIHKRTEYQPTGRIK